MVFIKKTTSSPAKSILEKWLSKRDIQALYDEPNQTGKKLWKLIRSKRGELNAALRLEQDNICGYCCEALFHEDSQIDKEASIDHFLTKSAQDRVDKARAFAERVFNYDNLIVSCDGGRTDVDTYIIRKNSNGDIPTKEDIATELGIKVGKLNRLNPLAKYELNEEIKYSRKDRLHCDAFKDDSYLPILNPTREQNCWQLFNIERNSGLLKVAKHVKEPNTIELIENTIVVLNLNVETLAEERKKRFLLFESLIEAPEFKELYPSLIGYIDSTPRQPFCFVQYHVIQGLIGNF